MLPRALASALRLQAVKLGKLLSSAGPSIKAVKVVVQFTVFAEVTDRGHKVDAYWWS